MPNKNLSAGDFVDARCTRCRVVTNHTIVAMVEDRVARVQCNTCNGVHNYRPPKPRPASTTAARSAKTAGAAKSPRKAKAAVDLDHEEWLTRCRNADPTQAAPYQMAGRYRVDDLVAHPVFGLGIVRSLSKPNKMEVLFEEGRKLLRCSL